MYAKGGSMLAEKNNATNLVEPAGHVGSGDGNGGSATRRPPMGGDGAAGWDEGTSQFVVPQSVVPVVPALSAPSTTSPVPQSFDPPPEDGSVEEAAQGASSQSAAPDYGNYSPPPMRPPTPPANHWSVRQPA